MCQKPLLEAKLVIGIFGYKLNEKKRKFKFVHDKVSSNRIDKDMEKGYPLYLYTCSKYDNGVLNIEFKYSFIHLLK